MPLNTLILRKDGRTYETKIIEYIVSEGKIKLQLLDNNSRSICLFTRDKIDVGIPQKGGFCHFESTILYRDVIDHYVIIDYPQNIVKEERRRFKRLYIHLNIHISYNKVIKSNSEIEILNSKINDSLITVMMSNISLGGLAFYSIEEFNSGESVYFNFTLPNDISFINLQGKVKFSTLTKYPKVREYGVQFIDLLPGNREALKDFIFTYISSQPSTAED